MICESESCTRETEGRMQFCMQCTEELLEALEGFGVGDYVVTR